MWIEPVIIVDFHKKAARRIPNSFGYLSPRDEGSCVPNAEIIALQASVWGGIWECDILQKSEWVNLVSQRPYSIGFHVIHSDTKSSNSHMIWNNILIFFH